MPEAQTPPVPAVNSPPYDTFTVRDFALECGTLLPEATIAYRVEGERTHEPPIVTCSAFSQSYLDLGYLFGDGCAVDPSHNWVVHTELLANGRSSSPSNYPVEGHKGPNFPPISIRDNVRLQHLLMQYLEINAIRAVVGASMGAQQALQWAVSYPSAIQGAIAIVGSCRTSLHAQLFLNSLANALRSDPAFNGGSYTSPPLEGLARMSECWAPWALSPRFFSKGEHQKYSDTAADDLPQFLAKWRTRYFQKDANNLLSHLRTWQQHDIALTPGFNGSFEKAARSIRCPTLFLPSRLDPYFNYEDIEDEARLIEQSQVVVIESASGHAAGFGRSPDDRSFINHRVASFMTDFLT